MTTKRAQILNALAAEFGGDNVVYRAPVETMFDRVNEIHGFVLAMTALDGEDLEKLDYQNYRSTMPVTVERMELFEPVSSNRIENVQLKNDQAETILGTLLTQALTMTDRTLGGLAELVDLAGTNLLIPTEQIKTVGASIVLRVRYRFSVTDPTQ